MIGLPREHLDEAGGPKDQAGFRRRWIQRTQGESRMRAGERQAIQGLGGAGVVVRAPFGASVRYPRWRSGHRMFSCASVS